MSQVAVDAVEVATIKFTVYRDEIDGSWESFLAGPLGPLRYIVAKTPLLRLCRTPHCNCPHWHNSEEVSAREAILDVWRRQFLQNNFHPEAAASATVYTVCVRVPEVLLSSLLNQSGCAGIYNESRTLDARAGLARAGERVGIRVPSNQAAAVHKTLKPESIYLPAGPKQEGVLSSAISFWQ